MKFWLIALLGAALSIATTTYLLLQHMAEFSAQVAEKKHPVLGPRPVTVRERFWSFRSDEMDSLLQDLKDQRTQLATRENDLKKLEAQVNAEKAELEKVLVDIQGIRDGISKSLPEVRDAEVANLRILSKEYSQLQPSAAVAIFLEMDDLMVVKILAFMKTDKVSAILGEMAKSKSANNEPLARRAARLSDKLRLLKPIAAPKSPA